MDGRFFVAAGAFCWRAGQNRRGMAIGTVNGGMGTIQNKEIVMVKGIHQRIPAVMAGQAIFTKKIGVAGHKIRLACGMAIQAINQLRHQPIFQVAVMAFQARFIKILIMPGQTEIRQLVMFKISQSQKGNISFSPFMFGVAVLAAGRVVQTAV